MTSLSPAPFKCISADIYTANVININLNFITAQLLSKSVIFHLIN